MSFNNKFVVCVLHNGQVCQESKVRGGYPRVTLPDGSEYGLRLRNKNDRRAVGEIFIDGESQGAFVINAFSYIDIFRPGHKDAAFKLVGVDSAEAVDHGKNCRENPNGTVVVKFRLERRRVPVYGHQSVWPYHWPSNFGMDPLKRGYSEGYSEGVSMNLSANSCQSKSLRACSVEREELTSGRIDMGVTVEGERTGQNFRSTSLDLEYEVTEVGISLLIERTAGFTVKLGTIKVGETVTPERLAKQMADAVNAAISLKYCTNCGTKKVGNPRFCGGCGNKF